MKVKIYQIDIDKYPDLCFMDYDKIHQKLSDKEIFEHCDLSYECERDDDYSPEKAFEEFNIYIPEDYKHSSLSIGDVVILDDKAYYCDFVGWKELKL